MPHSFFIQQNYRSLVEDSVLFDDRHGKHHHAACCGNGSGVHFFLELNPVLTDWQINGSYVSTELTPPVSSLPALIMYLVDHYWHVQAVDCSCKHITNSGQKIAHVNISTKWVASMTLKLCQHIQQISPMSTAL